jgi:hypothetical protein
MHIVQVLLPSVTKHSHCAAGLSYHLKQMTETSDAQRVAGRLQLFHKQGPATKKLRSPNVLCDLGTSSVRLSAGRSRRWPVLASATTQQSSVRYFSIQDDHTPRFERDGHAFLTYLPQCPKDSCWDTQMSRFDI